MKIKMFMTGIAVLFMVVANQHANADGGVSQTKSMETLIKEQAKVINDLKSRVNALESKQDNSMSALPITLENIAPRASWAEKTVIKGDFRYRHEYIDDKVQTSSQTKKKYPRNRHRIRARVGVFSKVQDDLDVGVQLTTSESKVTEAGEPTSGNQSLGGAFSKKSIWLDLAYADWHPKEIQGLNTDGLHLIAGKMKDPFYHVGKTQLILDGDLTPEGGAMTYEYKFNDKLKAFTNIGGFWVQERAGSLTETLAARGLERQVDDPHVDSALWAFQGGVKAKIADPLEIITGISFYNFTGVKHQKFFYDEAKNGNTYSYYSQPGNPYEAYAKDYDIINPFIEAKFKIKDMPFSVFTDFAKNATKNDSLGVAVGYTINKCEKPNSWEFLHEFRDVERDAVIAAFADSDFAGGLSGYRGHKLAFKYQLTKNVDIQTTLFLTKIDTHVGYRDQIMDAFDHKVPSVNRWESYNRWQLDLNVKF